MVYQVDTGDVFHGRKIKVPQTYIPSVIRAIILGQTADETQQLNVIHCLSTNAAPTFEDVQTVAETVIAWCGSDYADIVSNKITFMGVHARGMNARVAAKYETVPSGLTGNLANECLPYYVTLPCQWTTGITGPATRGMFYPFTPDEAQNDPNGHPSSAYQGAVVSALASLRGALSSASFPLIIASFKYSTVRSVLGNGVLGRWGTQVHRKIGRGR